MYGGFFECLLKFVRFGNGWGVLACGPGPAEMKQPYGKLFYGWLRVKLRYLLLSSSCDSWLGACSHKGF